MKNKLFGLFGFLGFLSFIPKHNGDKNYFFIIFFSFFSWFIWNKIDYDLMDERLKENFIKASNLLSLYFALTAFTILFLLDRNISREIVLLTGSILYTISFFLKPLLILYYERE